MCRKLSDFFKIFGFLKSFQIFGKVSEFLKVFRFFETFCDLRLETLITFLTIENNNINIYIVTLK